MNRALPALALLLVALPGCRERSKATEAVEVAVGNSHACARLVDGAVRCWGGLALGQRGQGATLSLGPWRYLWNNPLVPREIARGLRRPNQVVNLGQVEEIAAGAKHSCARRKGGTIWCWGSNLDAELGVKFEDYQTQDQRNRPYPVRVPGLVGAAQVVAGDRHTCARRSDGTVWCWGETTEGELGREDDSAPGPVPGISTATEISTAANTTCALLTDGTVRCWGSNRDGQVGDGTAGTQEVVAKATRAEGLRDVVEVAPGATHACARQRSGAIRCWGTEAVLGGLEGSAPAQLIATGHYGTCAYREGGLACAGSSTFLAALARSKGESVSRENGSSLGKLPGVKQLVVGTNHVCALQDSGAVLCWGASFREAEGAKAPYAVEGVGKAIHLSAFDTRTCAVSEEGQVNCWGAKKKLERVEGITDATLVSIGKTHGCARRKKGGVVCWGDNARGQLGRGSLDEGSKVALEVPGLRDVEQLASTEETTCARLKDSTIQCWGDNRQGELGQMVFSWEGPESAKARPATVGLPESAVQLAAGKATFCAALGSGGVTCWGDNTYTLALVSNGGSAHSKKPPTQVQGVAEATQIAVGHKHACALTKSHTVFCWGDNSAGALGDGTLGLGNKRLQAIAVPKLARATQIVVGKDATCGRLPEGRYLCLGGGLTASWEIPGLQNVKQVALGDTQRYGLTENERGRKPSGCAVLSNGALVCWGDVALAYRDRPPSGTPTQVVW